MKGRAVNIKALGKSIASKILANGIEPELLRKYLADYPQLINYRDSWGRTFIHLAAYSIADADRAAVFQALIDSGCDIYAVDNSKWTATDYAAFTWNEDILDILKQHNVPYSE